MEERQMYFPLYINLRDRKIVIVGGGVIAQRRAEGLLDFGPAVTVVSPRVTEGLAALAGEKRLVWEKAYYEEAFLKGADLVLAATDEPEINRQVYEACRRLGIPVNCADSKELCDFYFPALVRSRDLVIGVSSSGQDHRKVRRIAARLREWLEGQDAETKEGGF